MTRLLAAGGLVVAAMAMQSGAPSPQEITPPPDTPPSAVAPTWTKNNRYDDVFQKYTRQYFGPGFDWKVFKAQAMAESNLSKDAKSWVGARGLMQLMPATFREIQTKNPQFRNIDDPRWNIAAGIFYNKKLYDAWAEIGGIQSRMSYVLGSYNAGRGTMLNAKETVRKEGDDEQEWNNVEQHAHKVPRWRYPETLNYVRRIQIFYGDLSARNGFESFLPPPDEQPAPSN